MAVVRLRPADLRSALGSGGTSLATGCEIVQGYVFGPEVSASEVSALARRPA